MLKPWRYVMEPHPDVACGRFKQAEFAADLAQVVRGEGSPEYVNPVEFFSRTYLTGGLKNLLVKTLTRLTKSNGEPVVQLKTAFGGGKTHSLLALYHLFGGKIRAEQSSAVREILQAAQVEFLPRVQTAVIVGTWTNPLKSTLWGEIAAQLAKATDKPELYELIRENDEQKISPGVEALKKLFDAASPCLILIDEVVAYGRKLQEGTIDGGTFGNLLSFIQELTEAAKHSDNCEVVVSIPESDAEVGDELGRRVLEQVEKYFGRVEFVWESATPVEGYEIVRRRLFKRCNDDTAREETCSAFFNMYVNNKGDFPNDSRQNSYRERLAACYPIHPQLFDYLYDKWTSLENFQKTRGVLRLMANVIHCLWTQNDQSALIMPGNVPLDFAPVRAELAKYFKGNLDAIINSEVDGDKSKPYELDADNPRFGRLNAARKITRTIFIGTAPSSRTNDLRGIAENEIHLATIQPQDFVDVSTFNDALRKLKENLYYLYSQGSRLWFGVNPTLRKLVDDRREQFSDVDVDFEIEKQLMTWQKKVKAKTVQICPKSSDDVADQQTARLVILAPKYSIDAVGEAQKILDNRGTIQRRHRNMLLFMAADVDGLRHLRKTVREFMAWSSVNAEVDALNLDRQQTKDAKSNLESARNDFYSKLSQTYSRAFAPRSDIDLRNVYWDEVKLNCTTEDNITAAFAAFKRDDLLLESMSAGRLLRLLDEYEFIWKGKDAVRLNQLWEYFTTLYYMPRLVDVNVLLETVRKGVAAKTFALAADETLAELQFGDVALGEISLESFLVKAEVAQAKLKIVEPPPKQEKPKPTLESAQGGSSKQPEEKPLSTRFYMDTALDQTRCVKTVKGCMENVVALLEDLPGAQVSVRLVVSVDVPDGIPTEIEEAIAANCAELNVDNSGFER